MTIKIVFLVCILSVLATLNGVNAIDYNITCVNGNLIKNGTLDVNGQNYVFFQNTTCPYGCASNGIECDELVRSDVNFVLYPISMLIISAIFGFLAVKTEKKYFQFLFLGLTMLFIIIGMGLFAGFLTMTASQMEGLLVIGYQASIFGTFFVLFILVILIIMQIFENMKVKVV
jgi:hypothetical protein